MKAARQMNTTPGHISQCVNGNYKTSCGYIWKYTKVGDANAY